MPEYMLIDDSTLTGVANSIRTKTGAVGTMTADAMAKQLRRYKYSFMEKMALGTISSAEANAFLADIAQLSDTSLRVIRNYQFYGLNNPSFTSIVVPSGITSIGTNSFENSTSLTGVTVQPGITKLEARLFSGCSGLTSVTIPNTVTNFGNYVFTDCTSLTNIIIPDSVTTMGNYTFQNCNGLVSVTLSENLTGIFTGAFRACTALPSITIPDSVTSIGASAFYGCISLDTIFIPSSVTDITEGPFFGSGITDIYTPLASAPSGWNADFAKLDNTPTYATVHYGVTRSEYEAIISNTP